MNVYCERLEVNSFFRGGYWFVAGAEETGAF